MPNLAQNQVLQIQADGLDFGVCTDLEPDLGFQPELSQKNTRDHCFDCQEHSWY